MLSSYGSGLSSNLIVHVDESPWPVMGLKEWLWVLTGVSMAVDKYGHPSTTRLSVGPDIPSKKGCPYLSKVTVGEDFCLFHEQRYPVS